MLGSFNIDQVVQSDCCTQPIYMGQLIMIFIWKSLKDLKCLKHIIQIPQKFTQSSYKGSYID